MNEEITREVISLAESLSRDEIDNLFNECTGGKQFGSYTAPAQEAKIWADAFYEDDKDVFIVIGTGRLHYHQALADRLRKEQTLFVLDWKLPLIASAMLEDVHLEGSNITCRFSRNYQEIILSVVGILDRYITKKIKFGIIPPYRYFFPEEIQNIETEIKNFITVNFVRSRTIELFGIEWTTNYNRNLPHILNRGVPFQNFAGQFKDMPAVVVSAGPSLEKNIKLLPEISDKAVIIAAGSSIETLVKEYNITPHFLTSFDAGVGNYPHFQNLDTKKLRLIYTGDIYPRIPEEFEGDLIPVEAANKPTYELYRHYGAPPLGVALIGPSVANFALDIAVRLGCNPVILIGQDLALRDGKSHAKGNHYCTDIEDLSDHIKVKGNVEEFVYTNKSWLTMLKNFEQQVRLYKKNVIINATEGGAFIEGTTIKLLSEVIEEHMTGRYDIEDKIQSIIDGHSTGQAVQAQEVLSKLLKDVHKIKKLIEENLPEIDKLLLKIKNGVLNQKDKKRIQAIKKKEDRLIESLIYMHIIKTIIYGRILYYERYYSRLSSEQPDKVELWVAEYQKMLFGSARDALNVYLEDIGAKQPVS